MARLAVLTLTVALSAATPALAQSGAAGLTAPRPSPLGAPGAPTAQAASQLGTPLPVAQAPDDAGSGAQPPSSDPLPDAGAAPSGPRIELGYALYSLWDGEARGRVHAGSFGGYFHTAGLRLGARAELGKRADPLTVDDLLVRAEAVAGYQLLRSRWVPYLVAVGTYGWLIGQGSGAPRTEALAGGGLELGVDLRLGAVFLGLSVGWTRVGLRGEAQDLWLLRFRAGV